MAYMGIILGVLLCEHDRKRYSFMGLRGVLRALARSIDAEYDRRIRSASLVKTYDPTGASHHDHVAIHNERVEQIGVDGEVQAEGREIEPAPHQQSAPRQVTHR